MEDSVQPILKPMMLGKGPGSGQARRSVSRHGRRRRHLCLIIFTLPPASVPDSHYGRFRTQKQPLESQFIVISHRIIPSGHLGDLLGTALKQPVTNLQADAGAAQALGEQLNR